MQHLMLSSLLVGLVLVGFGLCELSDGDACCPGSMDGFGQGVGKVCCRARNCSLCSGSTEDRIDGQPLRKNVELILQPVALGGLCPGGTVQANSGGVLCTRTCMSSSSSHNYVYHGLAESSVPTVSETCEGCCALSFSDSANVPCSSECNFKVPGSGTKCYVCSADSTRAGQPCDNVFDVACRNISQPTSTGNCINHPCTYSVATFAWYMQDSFTLKVTAPVNKMYQFEPTHSGWLILHYMIRIENHRTACCPPSDTDTCCGIVAAGTVCNGEDVCSGGGLCSPDCQCPIYSNNSRIIKPAVTSEGDQPCWLGARYGSIGTCPMFETKFEMSSGSLQFHSQTGFASMRTLYEEQQQNAALRPSESGRRHVTLTGKSVKIDVEVAARVVANNVYTLQATTFNIFDLNTQKKNTMCPEVYKLPLKPTAMSLRSYVIEYDTTGIAANTLPTQSNAASTGMSVVDACEGMSTCTACLAFETNELRCDYLPISRRCVPRDSVEPTDLERATRTCSNPQPELSDGKGPLPLSGSMTLLVIFTATGGGLAIFYNIFQARYRDSLKGYIDRNKALLRHEKEYQLARHGDERILQDHKVKREASGCIEYHREKMADRVKDVNTPEHLMDPLTVKKHQRKWGVQGQ